MRVLMWRSGSGHIPGGHQVQLEQTRSFLRPLGVRVDVTLEESPDLDGYDLVHGFGLQPRHLRRCRQYGLPVAYSTIYWDRAYVTGQHYTGQRLLTMRRRLRSGLRLLEDALRGRHVTSCEVIANIQNRRRVCYEMADLLLPNSVAEAHAILAELEVTTPYFVVPNAVDHYRFRLPDVPAADKRDHVLYAGRFEPHKNQLGLIEAMRGSDVPVVLVGPPHPDHGRYYEECKQKAGGNVSILPGVPHEELPPLYSRARVHAVPSWFETTGLVSLEAALCGCNIVTTARGYARDYFGDQAWYCDPADRASIRRAVEEAFQTPFRSGLRQHILGNFTWEHAAEATRQGYEVLLNQSINRATERTGVLL